MKIKICGVRDPIDAAFAANAGADYIGMIFSKKSKRHISVMQAIEICEATNENGAIPVGVFVDESLDQILLYGELTRIKFLQLHGEKSQQQLPLLLMHGYRAFYAISIASDGSAKTTPSFPKSVHPLFDYGTGGTGQTFDWTTFCPPKNSQWFLAGGLTPNNVERAVQLLKPFGVDVSSGVENTCGLRKDPRLVEQFINYAKKEIL